MANKKEMMVLGGAAAGIASYYLYGKVKPKEESGKNNANPAHANAQSKLKDSHVNTEDTTKETKFTVSGKSGLPVEQKLRDSKIEGKMVTLPEIMSRSEGEDEFSKKKTA